MNHSPALSVVTDDIDDTCSCGSIYHSLINTPVDESLPPLSPGDNGTVNLDPFTQPPLSVPQVDERTEKDQRSYERARQRLKKPEDIRKAKRCVRCRMCKPEKWAGNAGRPKQGSRHLRASLTDAEHDRALGLEDSTEFSEEHPGAVALSSPRVVTLAELVKPARKRSDKQFEIVGRPRQVLVMDEFSEVNDLDDWEYVEKEAKHRKAAILKAPTYARVVARA